MLELVGWLPCWLPCPVLVCWLLPPVIKEGGERGVMQEERPRDAKWERRDKGMGTGES